MDSMMEDILLPLDKADKRLDSASYKKMLDGDACSDRSEQVHAPLAHKSSDCHRASSVHKTDAEVFLNKEPTPTLSSHPMENNSSVKPKLSSAFTISSILSMKTVSSFSTNLPQTSNSKQSPHLKMTNSASDYIAGTDARAESYIAKTSEMKHNSNVVHSNSFNKPNNSAVDYHLDISKRHSSLEITNGQLLDDLPESAEEHILMDVSTDTVEAQVNEGNDLCIKTPHKMVDDEDMHVEIINPLAANNECYLSVSETKMDDPLTENESVASAKEGKTKKTVDGKTVSTLRSDFHDKLDSSKEILSECDESNIQSVTYHDKLIIDENTHINNFDYNLVSDNVDKDACKIKVSKNATIADDRTTDASVDDFDADKKGESGEANSPISLDANINENEPLSDSKLSSNNSEENKYFNDTQSFVVDSCIVNEFESSENQKLSKLEYKSNETKSAAGSSENEQSLNIKVTNLPSENTKSLFDQNCESKDFASVGSEVIEIPAVKNNPTAHSKNVKDNCETKILISTQEIDVHSKKVKFLDKNFVVNKAYKVQDGNTNIRNEKLDKMVVEKSSQLKHNIPDDKDKTECNVVDDEILFVDETVKSEPINSSVQKYTFKNILFMPKDNIILNTKKNTSIVEKSECLKSSETVIKNKPLTTVSTTDIEVEDKHNIFNTQKNISMVEKSECLKSSETVIQNKPLTTVSTVDIEVEDQHIILNTNKHTSMVEKSECLKSSETIIQNKPLTTVSTVDIEVEDKHIILNTNKNISMVEKSECLKSSETVIQNKPLTTVSTTDIKVEDKQSSELKVALNTKMDSVEGLQNNESANERKRFLKSDDVSATKRSRLDSMDDKEEKKAKDTSSRIFDDDVTLAEMSVASAEDNDVTKLKDDRTVSLSSEALQSLITLRVKAFIKNKKQANLDRLNLRTRGMQSASNLWKETAKHLERSVLELTALNQKLESRKAHLLAVKRLSSRSIGTQVIEENVNTSSSVANVTASPTSNPAQRNQPLDTQVPIQRTGRPGRPPRNLVSNIPSTSLQPAAATQHEKVIQPPVSKTLDTQMQENSVNLIDLTDDEDISRNVVTKASTPISQPVNNAVGLNKSVKGGKITASTPGNGYVQPSRILQGTPGTLVGSSNQTVQPSTSGSQHTTGNSTVGAAGSQHQPVSSSNSAAQHSSTVNALILGSRSGAATNTYVSPGQPNTPTNTRVPPQNSAPSVASPAATASAKTAALSLPPSFLISTKHPAPMPFNMDTGNAPPTAKKRPPKPSLKISRVSQGIVLSWNMPSLFDVEKISSYQLYAYQESDSVTPRSSLWKKVGEVSALPLPMACTLTQFQEGNKYHFAVRAVDQYGRCGSYSDPSSIYLGPKT